jgi:hypothetical protein
VEWGLLLTLGENMWLTELELRHDHSPEVILQTGNGWYTEAHYRFDGGFIADKKCDPFRSLSTCTPRSGR